MNVGDFITAFCLGRPRYGKVVTGSGDMWRWLPIEPPVPRAELWVDATMEHIIWLSGHPPLDSDDVRALQVARALR